MRILAPALLLTSILVASGAVLAQAGASTSPQPTPQASTPDRETTATSSPSVTGAFSRAETQRFIARYDAPTRTCIDRCISGSDVLATSTLGPDGSTWTVEQFVSLWPDATRLCIKSCPGFTTVVGSTEKKGG